MLPREAVGQPPKTLRRPDRAVAWPTQNHFIIGAVIAADDGFAGVICAGDAGCEIEFQTKKLVYGNASPHPLGRHGCHGAREQHRVFPLHGDGARSVDALRGHATLTHRARGR